MQSLSCPLAFPQHWWATTARKLQPLSPISSHAPSKCKSNVKNGFDVATCSRTTTGTDGQLTLTVINPSQCYCLILIGEATFPVLLIPCYSLNNPVHIYTHTHICGGVRRPAVRQDRECKTVPATQSDNVFISPLQWSRSPWFNECNLSSLLNKQAEPVRKTSTSPFIHLSLKFLRPTVRARRNGCLLFL